MAGSALRRLMAEYKQLTLNPPEGIIAGPIDEENFFEWEALITGQLKINQNSRVWLMFFSIHTARTSRNSFRRRCVPRLAPLSHRLSAVGSPHAIHMQNVSSQHLCGRKSLHFHSARAWRWSAWVRKSDRTVESRAECRKSFAVRFESVCRAERWKRGQCGCGENVSRKQTRIRSPRLGIRQSQSGSLIFVSNYHQSSVFFSHHHASTHTSGRQKLTVVHWLNLHPLWPVCLSACCSYNVR